MQVFSTILLTSLPIVYSQGLFLREARTLANGGDFWTDSDVCKQVTTSGCQVQTLNNYYQTTVFSPTLSTSACASCFQLNPTQCYTCSSGSDLYVTSSATNVDYCFTSCAGAGAAGSICLTPEAFATVNPKLTVPLVTIGTSACNTASPSYPVQPSTCGGSYPTTTAVTSTTCTLTTTTSSASCFSGSDSVTLESGASKALSEVAVGDRILSANSKGELSFSDVVFLPHGTNDQVATFVEIATSGGKQLKATEMHLLKACDGSLVYAGSLKEGSCLRTVDGDDTVKSASRTVAKGLYTAVTQNEFLVVGGVVSSPFAVSHGITHAFYNIHRALYKLAPSALESSAIISTNALVGSATGLAISFWTATN